MKYGQHLYNNRAPEYGHEPYLKYRDLDNIRRVLNPKTPIVVDPSNRKVSLSAPPPSDASGEVLQDESSTEEDFYNLLDAEMAKVETFTQTQVKILRDQIAEAETLANVAVASTNDDTKEKINVVKEKSDVVAEGFLRLEKYVNINFMGFHKILKKHDKYLPSNPCKTFYLNRLHNQAWVRGDYSDLVVRLSHIYSTLRNDKVVEDTSGESQSFLRSTTKYWVKTEDVSRVKYEVLRHLPVFLQKTSTGESDSQLTNSVYLDNDQLELYHNRLDKTPGAIALRLRWYGTGSPSTVFVERKTHQDTWTGEVSVKERFMCDETDIQRIMTDSYDIDKIKENMVEKGTSQTEVQDWEALVKEVVQVIGSKQLIPTMRTQVSWIVNQ
jgi:SPX domain protein involved in polyphosphate accumulation